MHGERSCGYVAEYRVAPRQSNDEWSRKRPGQPARQLGSKQRRPRVMPALRMHDEYRLTRVE